MHGIHVHKKYKKGLEINKLVPVQPKEMRKITINQPTHEQNNYINSILHSVNSD